MRARIRLVVIPVAVLLGSTAALAHAEDKTTDLKAFDKLLIEGCFDARLEPGTPTRAVVSATADQQQRIRVEQDGDRVRVGFADKNDYATLCRGPAIRVSITASFAATDSVDLGIAGSGSLDANVPRVAKLEASLAGSGKIALRGAAGDCKFTIGGSGSADASALACDSSAKLELNGSGSAKLAGKTKTCEVQINGSGDIKGSGFDCDSADITVNGSGSVKLAKIGSLKAQINGSGNVRYQGEPTMRGVAIHGSGSLAQE
jgi:hypothetical protein